MTNDWGGKTPPLTVRSAARVEAGVTDGAGTLVCSKCGGAKEPGRINSDKCRSCNNPRSGSIRKPTGRKVEHSVIVAFPPDMWEVLVAQATKRDMSVSDYVANGMGRVLKKDAGWVMPSPLDSADSAGT